MFIRADCILVKISAAGSESRCQAFPKWILITESTFVLLSTNILGKWGQNTTLHTGQTEWLSLWPWVGAHAAHQGAVGWLSSRVANTSGSQLGQAHSWQERTNNPINMLRDKQARGGSEVTCRRWDLEINFKLQVPVEAGNSGQNHPCVLGTRPLVHNQPPPAVCVLGNWRLSALLQRFTSEAVTCYLRYMRRD